MARKTEDKKLALDAIAQQLEELVQSPLYAYRKENNYHSVPGEGSPNADIVFIGEAPGKQEAQSGRPFVGASGKFLNTLLEGIGLKREDVFITNIVKDRPPENRDPSPQEVRLYAPLLRQQLAVIRPRVLAPLGRHAMNFLLEELNLPQKGQKISDLHGKVLQAETPHGTLAVVPLFHPAVALYNRGQRETLEQDFAVLKQFTSI